MELVKKVLYRPLHSVIAELGYACIQAYRLIGLGKNTGLDWRTMIGEEHETYEEYVRAVSISHAVPEPENVEVCIFSAFVGPLTTGITTNTCLLEQISKAIFYAGAQADTIISDDDSYDVEWEDLPRVVRECIISTFHETLENGGKFVIKDVMNFWESLIDRLKDPETQKYVLTSVTAYMMVVVANVLLCGTISGVSIPPTTGEPPEISIDLGDSFDE